MNVYSRGGKDLPKRSTHSKEAIQRDSHQTQNWDEGQRDDYAAEKQTAVDSSLGYTVHHHGRGYGHTANQKVGHSQGDDQAQGGLLDGLRGPKRQDNQHVSKAAEDSSDDLQSRVGRFIDVHSFTLTFSPDREQASVCTGLFFFCCLSRSYETLRKYEAVRQVVFFFLHVLWFLCTGGFRGWFPFQCAGHVLEWMEKKNLYRENVYIFCMCSCFCTGVALWGE